MLQPKHWVCDGELTGTLDSLKLFGTGWLWYFCVIGDTGQESAEIRSVTLLHGRDQGCLSTPHWRFFFLRACEPRRFLPRWCLQSDCPGLPIELWLVIFSGLQVYEMIPPRQPRQPRQSDSDKAAVVRRTLGN